ncbi:hypothetical protein NKG94_33105 [Micromonospora sp. M12]
MSGLTMLVAALLLTAAALVAWPVQSIRARRRRVLAAGRGSGGVDPDDALVEWIRDLGRTLDGPVDDAATAPVSGQPVGIAYQSQTTAGASGRRTALGWPSRDVVGSPNWPTATTGGFTRPEGRRARRSGGIPASGRHRPTGGRHARRRAADRRARDHDRCQRRGGGPSQRRHGRGDHRRAR